MALTLPMLGMAGPSLISEWSGPWQPGSVLVALAALDRYEDYMVNRGSGPSTSPPGTAGRGHGSARLRADLYNLTVEEDDLRDQESGLAATAVMRRRFLHQALA